MIISKQIDYHDDEVGLRGYCAYEESGSTQKPTILVCHDWSGRNEFACEKADKLAALGYVGFALDMYGDGQTGKTNEEKTALMQPLMKNRHLLQRRIQSALNCVKSLEMVNPHKIAAIGFCFGGLCVLDLARSGADLQGVVSFHGLLHAPDQQAQQTILANILVLHGYDDPMVKPEQVIAFANEMTQAKANWQLDMYGHTMHAFTNPLANDASFGTVYNKQAAHRSWVAMQAFLHDIFEAVTFK